MLFHLAAIPVGLLAFRYEPPPEPDVALVRIPASEWDAAMDGARALAPPARGDRKPDDPKRPAAAKEEPAPEPKAPEKAPGQVVETAPGNRERPSDARLAAESDNRVEKETVSRDRRPEKVVAPKATAPAAPDQQPPGEPSKGALAIGEGGTGDEKAEAKKFGTKLELPSIARRDELKLEISPEGVGALPNRTGSEELKGNSDRFRVQVGEGEDPEDRLGGTGEAGGRALQLFPSAAVVDRITAAPAPDHVEGVEEGDGTFLNTREWKYASFMNRLKKGVSQNWDPNGVARTRDPTGNVYLWKDRYTVVSVTLRSDGSLDDVFVQQSSGVDFLDREAVAAFERAQPFPHPPRGMMDEDGRIHFQFGFFIDTSGAGFRFFRR
ncbi:MAG TPA: TonB family protein [Vulgatibacter sp.]